MGLLHLSPALVLAGLAVTARAAEIQADPSTYLGLLGSLQPGDTLELAAGTYTGQLAITGLNGTPCAWITIAGPATGAPAVFTPNINVNTVEITNSSYLALENLVLDGEQLDGPFGISANGGSANSVHHILIQGCTIQNFNGDGGDQQIDGISTKTPTWAWILRGNQILNAGTGVYLGNSDGTDPFVGGLIEDNYISDPIGYCMEIKYQIPWPTDAGLPTEPSSTIIRNNVFIKNDQPSPDGTRPNLLVGGFPDGGPGAQNLYEIYGNLFVHNVAQPLFQFSGRVAVHDNIFLDSPTGGIFAQNQDLPLELAYIYDNTFFVTGTGINFAQAAPQGGSVVGNLVFAGTPLGGMSLISDLRDNLLVPVADAGAFVGAPSITPGQASFFPLTGQCQGTAIDMSKFANNLDYDLDFNGVSREPFAFRGAYAGQGTNPGWPLAAGVKVVTLADAGACWVAPPDAGTGSEGIGDGLTSDAGNSVPDAGHTASDGGTTATDGGTPVPDAGTGLDAGTPADAGSGTPDAGLANTPSGCACASGGSGSLPWVALLLLALARARRGQRCSVWNHSAPRNQPESG